MELTHFVTRDAAHTKLRVWCTGEGIVSISSPGVFSTRTGVIAVEENAVPTCPICRAAKIAINGIGSGGCLIPPYATKSSHIVRTREELSVGIVVTAAIAMAIDLAESLSTEDTVVALHTPLEALDMMFANESISTSLRDSIYSLALTHLVQNPALPILWVENRPVVYALINGILVKIPICVLRTPMYQYNIRALKLLDMPEYVLQVLREQNAAYLRKRIEQLTCIAEVFDLQEVL